MRLTERAGGKRPVHFFGARAYLHGEGACELPKHAATGGADLLDPGAA